jgi:phenylacetate-coenzyme A ligase PaaK-like adenylate-forming protein
LRKQEQWTRQQLQEHQAAAFKQLSEYTYQHSPFYRRFHRGLEGRPLHELPVLSKAMMMQNFDDLVTDRAVHIADVERHLETLRGDDRFLGRYRVNATSGSTGRRGLFLFSHSEWMTALAALIRAYEWLEGPSYLPPRISIASIVSPRLGTCQARGVLSTGGRRRTVSLRAIPSDDGQTSQFLAAAMLDLSFRRAHPGE